MGYTRSSCVADERLCARCPCHFTVPSMGATWWWHAVGAGAPGRVGAGSGGAARGRNGGRGGEVAGAGAAGAVGAQAGGHGMEKWHLQVSSHCHATLQDSVLAP